MKIKIIGDGVFGTFLQEVLSSQTEIAEQADIIILAVPFAAYFSVAKENKGKHLVNVCSVQEDTNRACLEHSPRVTGLHPLFGPRSPIEGRTAILTHENPESQEVIELFRKVGCQIIRELPDGRKIDGKIHDQMMAQTHLAGVLMAEKLQQIVDRSQWIPDNCLPTSFKRMRELVKQFQDFSPGTLQSILSNKYGDNI